MPARNPILDRFFDAEFRPYRYRPVEFCRRILEIDPHPGQIEWLLNSTLPQNALTTGNQFGKSFIAGMKMIWRCAYEKGWDENIRQDALIAREHWQALNIAPTYDQALHVTNKARAFLSARRAQWLVDEIKDSPHLTVKMFHGGTIQARSTDGTGAKLLGVTVDYINWDEAAQEIKFNEIRENVVMMRLAKRRGMLDCTTTGRGRNEYGLYFLSGLPNAPKRNELIYSQQGTSYDNPFLPKDRLEQIGRGMSDRYRKQNILGQIVDAGGGFFDIQALEDAIDPDLNRINRIWSHDELSGLVAHCELHPGYNSDPDRGALSEGTAWHTRYPDHRYVHFWDLAKKQDWVVGRTIDASADRLICVEFERFNGRDWDYVYDRIRQRHNRYQIGSVDGGLIASSRTVVDSTGVGDVAVDMLKDIAAEPFIFTNPSKNEILAHLASELSMRRVRMPEITQEFDELKFYERDDEDLVQDCVMALAGAVHHASRHPLAFSFGF